MRQSGEVSGSGVFAGSGALSHAASAPKGPVAGEVVRAQQAFERISWDEALDEIARVSTRSLPNLAARPFCPTPTAARWVRSNGGSMDRRFFHRLGASQLARNICSAAGEAGLKSVTRSQAGHRARAVPRIPATSSRGARTFTATTSTCGRSSRRRAARAPSWW